MQYGEEPGRKEQVAIVVGAWGRRVKCTSHCEGNVSTESESCRSATARLKQPSHNTVDVPLVYVSHIKNWRWLYDME